MFDLRGFVKRGLLDAIGKMADYQVILNSLGWLEKGVLIEDDLADIQERINSLNPVIQETNEINEETEDTNQETEENNQETNEIIEEF